MTIDSIHAIAALCVGIVLIALPWLLPRIQGICTVHAMPQIPSGMQPYLPRMPYARFHRIQRAAICIHPHYAHTRHAYSASACSRRIPHLRGAMRITLSDHQNIIVNAGLPTAYGINQHIKIAFVLLLVPTVACWYAFLGSGLRGEQSYSPARPMVFRRGTPSIFKELLSGFSFATAQPALLWFASVPCWPSMAHRHSCWKMACLCLHMASGLSAALLYSRSPAAWHLVRSAHFNVCHVEVMPSTR